MKSFKREVGLLLLVAGLVLLYWFTQLPTPEMVAVYAPAIPSIIFALIAAGIAPFGIHHFGKKD